MMLRLTKTILAALAVFACVSADFEIEVPEGMDGNPELYIYESQLNETLYNLSLTLAEQDPLSIPKIQVSFGNDLARLDFEGEDILLIGFSKFIATDLKITLIPPRARFNIYIDKIQLVVPYYKLDALAVFVPLYGSGNMNLLAKGINFGGSATIALGIGGLSGIKNLVARFNLTDSNLQVSGLLNNEPMSQIVSTATTECFPEFVNTYGERLGNLVGGVLENIINEALQKPKPTPAPTPEPTPEPTEEPTPEPEPETEPEPEPTEEPGTEAEPETKRRLKGGDTVKIGPNTLKYYYEI